jgi:anti-sigma factor (TIGR02949 family)
MTPDRLTCEQMFRKLDDYLDRELSAEEADLVRAHLAECEVCAAEYQFERTILDEVRAKLRRIALPEGLRERLLARLRSGGEGEST